MSNNKNKSFDAQMRRFLRPGANVATKVLSLFDVEPIVKPLFKKARNTAKKARNAVKSKYKSLKKTSNKKNTNNKKKRTNNKK